MSHAVDLGFSPAASTLLRVFMFERGWGHEELFGFEWEGRDNPLWRELGDGTEWAAMAEAVVERIPGAVHQMRRAFGIERHRSPGDTIYYANIVRRALTPLRVGHEGVEAMLGSSGVRYTLYRMRKGSGGHGGPRQFGIWDHYDDAYGVRDVLRASYPLTLDRRHRRLFVPVADQAKLGLPALIALDAMARGVLGPQR